MFANSFYFFKGDKLFHVRIIAKRRRIVNEWCKQIFHKTAFGFFGDNSFPFFRFFKAKLEKKGCSQMSTFSSLDTTYPHYYTDISYGSNA